MSFAVILLFTLVFAFWFLLALFLVLILISDFQCLSLHLVFVSIFV